MALIEVDQLYKTFRVAIPQQGRFAALRTLLSRQFREVNAVEGVSFNIEQGETVGYIGPNGAGKSTTIKMLTGILVPTSGKILIEGRVPSQDRVAHVRRLGVVFGQRTQLWWDLPLRESFDLLRDIYRIPMQRWRENLNTFDQLLDLAPFLDTPVRQLSLGQRMRADLAAALLHDPSILFLDEPTIGLDVVARERIRQFLQTINRERGVTILLTTHDFEDIERLCPRVILIDHGKVMYDGALELLRTRYGQRRTLIVDLSDEQAPQQIDDLPHTQLIRAEGPRMWLSFDREAISAPELIVQVAERFRVRDLTVVEPDIESVVRNIYETGGLTPAL